MASWGRGARDLAVYARANVPGWTFLNRASLPLVAISLPIAADKVAAGVLPPGDSHSFLLAIASIISGHFSCLPPAKHFTAASIMLNGLPLLLASAEAFGFAALVVLLVPVFFVVFDIFVSPL